MNDENRKLRTIYVSKVSVDTQENTFVQYFQQFGNVTNVRLIKEPSFTYHYGFIEFENVIEQIQALSYPSHQLHGNKLEVTKAKSCIKHDHHRMRKTTTRQHHRGPSRVVPTRSNYPIKSEGYKGQRAPKEDRTVFVVNFSPNSSEAELIDFARECGDISNFKFNGFDESKAIVGRKKYALFEFYNTEGANTCLAKTGTLVHGVPLNISLSKTVITTRPPRTMMTAKEQDLVKRTVHVSGVHVNATKNDLFDFFGKAGTVEDVRIAGDATGRFDTRYAFVQFSSAVEAANGINLTGECIANFNRPVQITYAREPIGHRVFRQKSEMGRSKRPPPRRSMPKPVHYPRGGMQPQNMMYQRPPMMQGYGYPMIPPIQQPPVPHYMMQQQQQQPMMGGPNTSIPPGANYNQYNITHLTQDPRLTSNLNQGSSGYNIKDYQTNYSFKPVYNTSSYPMSYPQMNPVVPQSNQGVNPRYYQQTNRGQPPVVVRKESVTPQMIQLQIQRKQKMQQQREQPNRMTRKEEKVLVKKTSSDNPVSKPVFMQPLPAVAKVPVGMIPQYTLIETLGGGGGGGEIKSVPQKRKAEGDPIDSQDSKKRKFNDEK